MIEFGHSTHVGLRREHNEDTYYADADMGLWLVADGMGGHENGEVASALARDTLVSQIQRGENLARALASCDMLFNPSVTETFGNVTLEAMACGAAVVACTRLASTIREGVIVTVLCDGSVLAQGTLDQVQADERVIEVYLGR